MKIVLEPNSRTTELTWYHLVSHIFGPPKQKDVIANQSADWCGNLLPQDTACASTRFNGRTRGCLPIDTPAPRPCSAVPDLPHHTNRGSLKGFACVLFSSQLFSNIRLHYTGSFPHCQPQNSISAITGADGSPTGSSSALQAPPSSRAFPNFPGCWDPGR